MASVILHAFRQIRENGSMQLFRSHNPAYVDGGQMRDFIYVKDVVEVCYFFLHHRTHSGLYNLGTGQARTFQDLALGTFAALGQPADIRFRDTPADIRDTYQYFTEADMRKLRSAGYELPFASLEAGIRDYVQGYLVFGLVLLITVFVSYSLCRANPALTSRRPPLRPLPMLSWRPSKPCPAR